MARLHYLDNLKVTTMLSFIFTWLLRLIPGVKKII